MNFNVLNLLSLNLHFNIFGSAFYIFEEPLKSSTVYRFCVLSDKKDCSFILTTINSNVQNDENRTKKVISSILHWFTTTNFKEQLIQCGEQYYNEDYAIKFGDYKLNKVKSLNKEMVNKLAKENRIRWLIKNGV